MFCKQNYMSQMFWIFDSLKRFVLYIKRQAMSNRNKTVGERMVIMNNNNLPCDDHL